MRKIVLYLVALLFSFKSVLGAVDLTDIGLLKGTKGVLGAIAGFNLTIIAVIILLVLLGGGIGYLTIYIKFLYKYHVWLFEDEGLQTTIFHDKGRLIKDGNNRWIQLLWTKGKTFFPNTMFRVGKKKILFMSRSSTGDFAPISYFNKPPDENWIKQNEIITVTEDNKIEFDTDKIFPMLRPDNLKVRQIHTLLQREAITRFTKKELWKELMPYFTALGTVLLCFMMVVITLHTIGKIT